ncbi:unnamed protein product [Bemisia tabaci]|uniref:TIR domain-containing protein n=1 Tax=Bemisia tabaci TaxID=7038 RepID=A0A9P0A215_BEMTA|nr:unnamed protein product [Bemisia tabaci]
MRLMGNMRERVIKQTSQLALLVLNFLACALASEPCNVFLEPNATSSKLSAFCKLPTIPRELILPESDNVIKLRLECNQDIHAESFIYLSLLSHFNQIEEFNLTNCKVAEISENVFSQSPGLKKLTVNSRNFDWSPTKSLRIKSRSFRPLKELHHLDLSFNNMDSLPDGVFCPLKKLQHLNLSNNAIADITRLGLSAKKWAPPRVSSPRPTTSEGDADGEGTTECHGGSELRTLDLSANRIQSLAELSDVSKFKRLHTLLLNDNLITEIPKNAFSSLHNVHILNLTNNNIQTLTENVFTNCKELQEIHLQNNSLAQLPKGLLNHLNKLLILDLSSNQLTSNQIDESTFVGLIRLIVLNLSSNRLTRINSKTFKDLLFLQILDLHNNSIGFIENDSFLPLYNLHTLNLSNNRLHHVTSNLLNGLFVLTKLNLNNNLITTVDEIAFRNCSDLKELDLSSNAISELPTALTDLSFLKSLDLGENQISEIKPNSFKNMAQLTGLRLIDNSIGNLTKDMFVDLPNLQVLNLAKNKVQSIERGTFDKNVQIEAIRLDYNYLQDINGVFSSLVSLLWLNLSDNHLVWFDYAFLPTNLKWLDIHNNYIEKLGNYYKIMNELQLKTLDASYNRIVELNELSIPNSVEIMFVNNNMIRKIETNTFFDKKNLARVDIYANELSRLELNSLRLDKLSEDRNIPEFYIAGNPFVCDCNMDWLPAINNMTHLRQYPKIMDLSNIVCQMTTSRGTQNLQMSTSMKTNEFLCRYETHCFALCHCCDFDACDCEMTCPSNCTCYHDQTWNTNLVDCSNQNLNHISDKISMYASHVYLDGNNFAELSNHLFIGRKNLKVLFFNNSNIQTIRNNTFNGLSTLQTLHLEHNSLVTLYGNEFENLYNLKELYLNNNKLAYINNITFQNLRSLELLKLHDNQLMHFNFVLLNFYNSHLIKVSLHDNPWSCDCTHLQDLATYISNNYNQIENVNAINCYYNNSSNNLVKNIINWNNTACIDFPASSIIRNIIVSDYFIVVVSSLILLFLVLAILFVLFRDSFKYWLFNNYNIKIFKFKHYNSGQMTNKYYLEDRDKLYDAYVVYSALDENEFVLRSVCNELEPTYQICLHYRDLPAINTASSPYLQNSLTSVIIEAAEASKRIILVATKNFLQNEWLKLEFKNALLECLKGRIFKLIIIEDANSNLNNVDNDFRLYFKSCTRLKYNEKKFWDKLKYSMPNNNHSGTRHTKKACNNYNRKNINNYTIESTTNSVASNHSRRHQHYINDKNHQQQLHHHQHHHQQHPLAAHPLFRPVIGNGDLVPVVPMPVPVVPVYGGSEMVAMPNSRHSVDKSHSARQLSGDSSADYSSATTATPSPRPSSDHIYSSIDTPEYPSFDRTPARNQSWRAAPAPSAPAAAAATPGVGVDSAGHPVQAYLV